ncbi:ketoacyl-ACP synthase III [Streptomyces sp. NPDC086554]|uniref:3-oxoacyl-ACP synthase III family protein n=1 Tax=Streptomyces sp. NPDC086554 TaxID=3154864 RepID=UPI00341B7782
MTVYSPALSPVGVLGTGSCLPEHVVSNAAVAELAGVTPSWIERKTGIRERRYAADHQASSDLAGTAARRALDVAGLHPEQVRWIIVATSTPDHPQPATATLVQDRLGASRAAAFDVNAVCAGFVAALQVATRLLAGAEKDCYALVIGAEVYSRIIDRQDRRTAPLFGDGAGAIVLGSVSDGRGVLGTGIRTDGHLHELIGVPAGGSRLPVSEKTVELGQHYFQMQGRNVRDYVMSHLPSAVSGLLEHFGVGPERVDHFVPHQANGAMLKDVWKLLGLSRAQAHLPVEFHGNTGAASIPLALDHACSAHRLADDELVVLAGFGGGMTVTTALLTWGC